MPTASVKIMLSYDYNHFEICLGSDMDLTLKEVNDLRKSAQRLSDEAVRQYKVAKEKASKQCHREYERKELEREVDRIICKPEGERSATDKAKLTALKDHAYWEEHQYDYDDDEPQDH